MRPERIWYISSRLHARGHRRLSRLLKAVNYVVYHAILPDDMYVPKDITLLHHGMGTLVASSTIIGERVTIGHGVLISETRQKGGATSYTILEDHSYVGSNSLIKPRKGRNVTVGEYGIVGAHAVVIDSVPAHHTARPILSDVVDRRSAPAAAATAPAIAPAPAPVAGREKRLSMAS